jgi:hypothetical protein
MRSSLAFTASALLLGCTFNGKPFGPSATEHDQPGPSASGGARACEAEWLEQAHHNGMTGPCWDPPGEYQTVPPIHIVAGMRDMGRTPDGNDVYWFDMPKESPTEGRDPSECASLPTGHAYVADEIAYQPYADEDPLLAKPTIADMLGESLAQVLGDLDKLDVPLCVVVSWDESCQRAPGTLCDDQRSPDDEGRLRLTFAGKHPQ